MCLVFMRPSFDPQHNEKQKGEQGGGRRWEVGRGKEKRGEQENMVTSCTLQGCRKIAHLMLGSDKI